MLRAEVWLTTTLISLGIIGALIYNWPRSAEVEKGESPTPTASSLPERIPDEGQPEEEDLLANFPKREGFENTASNDEIERGDKFLLVGNHEAADRIYRKVVKDLSEPLPTWLLLKIGLNSEQAGNLEDAESWFAKAVRQSPGDSVTRTIGMLGISRIWEQRNQLKEAADVLTELFNRYGSVESVPAEIRTQIAYQLGTVKTRRFLEEHIARFENAGDLMFYWCKPNIHAALDFERDSVTSLEVVEQENEFTLLQRPAAEIGLIAIDAKLSRMPLSEFFAKCASEARVGVNLSPNARALVNGRSTRINVRGMSLAMVFDNLCSPLDLYWVQTGDQVDIRHKSELGEQVALNSYKIADRMLHWIELATPDSRRREASLLHTANLRMLIEDFDAAANKYDTLEKLAPNDELIARLSFNIGLLQLKRGEKRKAVDRFFFSVDQSLDQEVQSVGYARIGKLELESGFPARAIYAASRGLTLATRQIERERIMMVLAKSYLLVSDPFTANKVLFEHSDQIQTPSVQRLAAVYGAYARYLGTAPAVGLRNEGERMVVALAAVEPDDLTDFVDMLLVGRAFFEVGFTSRSTELLEKSFEAAKSENWSRRIAFEIGVNHYREGNYQLAADVFEKLSASLSDEAGVLAKIKLAEISLYLRKPRRCVNLCNELWEVELTDQQKANLLSVMGNAYQQLDLHHAAAVCFSGMLPQAVDSSPLKDIELDRDSNNLSSPLTEASN